LKYTPIDSCWKSLSKVFWSQFDPDRCWTANCQ